MADRIVTCVYCGHEYPDGTPTSQDKKLAEHIRICEKHPMRELEQQLAAANTRVDELEKELNETYVDEHGIVWTRPTAWAYMQACKANYKNREAKEQAEAQCAAYRIALMFYDHPLQRQGYVASKALADNDAGTALLDQNRRMREALLAWQQWEAELIMSRECWNTVSGLPIMTQEIYDKMIAIQSIREAALEAKPCSQS